MTSTINCLLSLKQAPPTPAYAPPTPALQVSAPTNISTMPNVVPTSNYSQLPGPPSNLNPLPQQQTMGGQTSHMSSVPLSLVQPSGINRGPTMFPPSLQTLEPVPPSSLPSGINVPSLLARVTPIQQQQQTNQQQQLLQQQQHAARIVQLPTQPIPQNRMAQIQTRAPPPVTLLNTTAMSMTQQQQQQAARIIRPQQQNVLTQQRPVSWY